MQVNETLFYDIIRSPHLSCGNKIPHPMANELPSERLTQL